MIASGHRCRETRTGASRGSNEIVVSDELSRRRSCQSSNEVLRSDFTELRASCVQRADHGRLNRTRKPIIRWSIHCRQ